MLDASTAMRLNINPVRRKEEITTFPTAENLLIFPCEGTSRLQVGTCQPERSRSVQVGRCYKQLLPCSVSKSKRRLENPQEYLRVGAG